MGEKLVGNKDQLESVEESGAGIDRQESKEDVEEMDDGEEDLNLEELDVPVQNRDEDFGEGN